MRFEKWQALGNDYVIVAERDLPFPLTPARVRALCAAHTGLGADGVLLLSETDERGFVAEVRIFNPDGSEAELSGNGVREAVLYLRRAGWTDARQFSIQTLA
ncbi:MAG TPA: diaminopimelate epimerase, partial [Methylomirabilota bacterium]